MTSESLQENIDLELMKLVYATTYTMHENELAKYGWEIIMAGESGQGLLRGQHDTETEAINAAIKWLRHNRPGLVREAREAALEGMRYRAARRRS